MEQEKLQQLLAEAAYYAKKTGQVMEARMISTLLGATYRLEHKLELWGMIRAFALSKAAQIKSERKALNN